MRAEWEGRVQLDQSPSFASVFGLSQVSAGRNVVEIPSRRSVIFPLLLLHYQQAPERLLKTFTAKEKSASSHVLRKLILEIME